MARYDAACAGTPVDPVTLYRWAVTVALAVFDDLATVEVAMRSAMARELASSFGLRWFGRADLLDDDTLMLVHNAWRVGRLGQLTGPPDVVHGKLVATLMFGFWVKLLGRGSYRGREESRERRIYDTLLWKPSLRSAFPNAGDLDRARVETHARRIQMVRNRIAHHEHIVWGVPLPGESDHDGSISRITVSDALETLFCLAHFVDAGLAEWLREHSRVRFQLAACPLDDSAGLLL